MLLLVAERLAEAAVGAVSRWCVAVAEAVVDIAHGVLLLLLLGADECLDVS